MAEIFAESFEGEERDTLERAFAMHMKSSKRFPTPAHIAEILPECRPMNPKYRLPESDGKISPGFGRKTYLQWRADRKRAEEGGIRQ